MGSISVFNKAFFSTPLCPDWPWGPPSLLFNAFWALFLRGKATG